MTKAELNKVLACVDDETPISATFSFARYGSCYDANLESVTVLFVADDKPKLVLSVKEIVADKDEAA